MFRRVCEALGDTPHEGGDVILFGFIPPRPGEDLRRRVRLGFIAMVSLWIFAVGLVLAVLWILVLSVVGP